MNTPPHLSHDSSHQGSNDVPDAVQPEPEVNQNVNPSDEDTPDISPASYFNKLDLAYFASEPLRMVFEHRYLMDLCLENDNPEAHYIEGINQYFFHSNPIKALEHLRHSAHGKYDKGTYLCGVLLLCNGSIKEGKKCLDTLDWEHTVSTSNSCWRKVKKVLNDYGIELEDMYFRNLARLKPPRSCDLYNENHLCSKCYYFLRVEMFVNYIAYRRQN